MFLAVILITNANNLVWQTLATFVAAFNQFTGFVQGAIIADSKAQAIIKGIAKDKKAKRGAMTDIAMLVKSAIQAYADTISDPALFDKVNFSRSKIMYCKSAVALTRYQLIYDTANPILASLIPFVLMPIPSLVSRMQ